MAAKKSGELAVFTQPNGAIVDPSALDFLSGLSGAGMEKVGMADVVMPRFTILQDLSPQIKERNSEYIPGARPGRILNVATGELVDSLDFVPAFYERRFIEWKPNRGGFVADHGTDEAIMGRVKTVDDMKNNILDNGNIIQETATWYILNLGAGGDRAILTMARTQLTPSRKLMSLATSEKLHHPTNGAFTPPLFFRSYRGASTLKVGDKNEWFIWKFERGPSVVDHDDDGNLILPGDVLPKAQAFQQALLKGEVRASAESFEDDTQPGGGGGRGGGKDSDTY